MLTTTGTHDEALTRFHRTGPEFGGWLSNHGPMVVEALAGRGHDAAVHRWTDDYLARLDELPRERSRIDPEQWAAALGDPRRTGDWIAFFDREVRAAAWPQVLALWWPRLLPGIAAGATHGVIRVGHATRALRAAGSAPRLTELAHALGYWAARWQPVPVVRGTGHGRPAALLGSVPRVGDQTAGVVHRLAQLPGTAGWARHAATLARPADAADVPTALAELVDAAVSGYPRWAHGDGTMLVHAATAPNAVAGALPSLPTELWRTSFDAAWSATAAVLAAYRPAELREVVPVAAGFTADDALGSALAHGGEHVIKLADTALTSYARTGDPAALAAVLTAVELDA